MSDATPKPPCAVCQGSYDEHFDGDGKRTTQHMYTETPGDLTTPSQRAKEQMLGGQGRQQINPAMLMGAGSNPISFGRLVEVLLEKNFIDPDEALYIAGMAGKPVKQFADPAKLVN